MTIHTYAEGAVLRLQIDRPERKNALTPPMYQALVDGMDRAAADPAIRAVIIHGSPECFTAGNDLGDFLNNPPGPDAPVNRFLGLLLGFEKPILAAVNGVAVGMGVTMLPHCDYVAAGDNALFSTPFIKLGLCPEAGSSLLLPRLIGPRLAAEMLLFARQLTAAEALTAGLVNAVLPPAATLAHVMERAHQLAALPAEAVRLTKKLLSRSDPALRPRIEEETAIFRRLLHSPHAKAAFAAFFQK